jgi:alpha-L-rhamnosidase
MSTPPLSVTWPRTLVVVLACLSSSGLVAGAEWPVGLRATPSPIRQFHVAPARIVWQSATGVENAGHLLNKTRGQSVLSDPVAPCVLTSMPGQPAGILLDFGAQIQGSVEIFTPMTAEKNHPPVRIRLGESVMECLTPLGERGAGNDHTLRDQVVELPWLGSIVVGQSGFRFCLIEAVDPAKPVALSEVRGILSLRDIPWRGRFKCDDERLNRIWSTGAWTVQLNMQEYLWDGIKRDRLVWIGDMHPETSTIAAVFGFNDVVPRSLDLTREVTPPTEWMNGISSYSMWWVLIHEQWYQHYGDRAYLAQQKPYLQALLKKLAGCVGPDGRETLDGMRFLDWPSSPNPEGVTAGLQALLVMTLESGHRLLAVLGDEITAELCAEAAGRARRVTPDANGSKSGAALLVLAGMLEARPTAENLLKVGGARGVSTFYGFYVLQALAAAGEIDAALDIISSYWGAMLDRGATTFWEDFDLNWLEGSGRIDEMVPPGVKDLHGDFGAYCYENFRHSLCHGWASGPTAWLSQHVLGIHPLEPGFRKVKVAPQLGRLQWAEGAYPTPHGLIAVRHERRPDGTIHTTIQAPPGVAVIR